MGRQPNQESLKIQLSKSINFMRTKKWKKSSKQNFQYLNIQPQFLYRGQTGYQNFGGKWAITTEGTDDVLRIGRQFFDPQLCRAHHTRGKGKYKSP